MTNEVLPNGVIARGLKLLGELMELHGEDKFKTGAYSNAYRALKNYDYPLYEHSEQELANIQGIGKNIAGKIYQWLHEGTFPLMEKYLELTPQGVVQMLQLKGIGPKKIEMLWKELGIENVGELLYACQENRISQLKGFGPKIQESLEEQILFIQQSTGHVLYAQAEPLMEKILSVLRKEFPQHFFEPTGEIRRKANTIGSLEILTDLPSSSWQDVAEGLNGEPAEEAGAFRLENGLLLRFYATGVKTKAYDLFETTGDIEHVQEVVRRGKTNGAFSSETDIYKAAGLPYIIPEMRENVAEWKWVKTQDPLVTDENIAGVLHAHSKYSDGTHSLADMANYCKKKGYRYFGISDHSQSAFYANGLKEADIRRQHDEIDELNKQLAPFKIFKGIESDILNDGRLDYPDEILTTFDFIIVSVHSNLKMTEEKAMNRLITAIENPYTTILGHSTGRLLLSRMGYPVDHKKLIDACAANGVAIEVNANPYRLDIDWRWLPYCMEKNVPVAINPDAHSFAGVGDIRYGVISARKGGLTVKSCLNNLDVSAIETYFKSKKK